MSTYNESMLSGISDTWLAHAVREIKGNWGHDVDVVRKRKSLLKFGRNDDIGTAWETVWAFGGDETYASTNAIDTVSSSNAGDGQTVTVEGHTIDGSGNFTFSIQSATLNGQSKVVLGTPLARASRVYNTDTTDFAGTVYVYEDDTVTAGVPDTAAKVHLSAPTDDNQSLKAATTISNTDYWIITQIYAGVARQNSRSVDFRYQIREKGGVFRSRVNLNAHSTGSAVATDLQPYLIVPNNADFRIRAISSGVTTGVEAWANGILASVVT